MFADESPNVVVKATEILSQEFLNILKALFTTLFKILISDPLTNRREIKKELTRAKKIEKRAEKMERGNNSGYRDNRGGMIPIGSMLKNKNDLSEVQLDYSFDSKGKPHKYTTVYQTDGQHHRPMHHETEMSQLEQMKAKAYLSDLQKLAKNRGLLCAVSERGLEDSGLGSTLLFRTKDSLKLNSVISSLQMITEAREQLYEAGVKNAFTLTTWEVNQMMKKINRNEKESNSGKEPDYEEETTEVWNREDYQKNVNENACPAGIEEEKLKTLVEHSNLDSLKDVIIEKYGSLENFYESTPSRREIFDAVKESIAKDFGKDMNKHYFHHYSDKENKLMFNDGKGGFHLVDFKNMEQEHFQDSRNFLRYMIKECDALEIMNLSMADLERMESLLNHIPAERLNELMEHFFEEINNEYEQAAKTVDTKYKDSPLHKDEMAVKALIQYEMDGNDSNLLKDCKNYLDVEMMANASPLVDKEKLLASNMDLQTKCTITNIMELEAEYDLKIPDDVKEMLYKSKIGEEKISLPAMEHLYEKAEEDPRILRNSNDCKEILKQGEEKKAANIRKAFGIENEGKTPQKEAVLGAGNTKDMKSEVSKSTVGRCEDIFNKYADGRIKPSKADMNVLGKNLNLLRQNAPSLYQQINANKAVAKEVAAAIKSGWKEKGR